MLGSDVAIWDESTALPPDSTSPETTSPQVEIINGHAYFNWRWQGVGFGQLGFKVSESGTTFETEALGKDRVRALLHALADQLADHHEGKPNGGGE